VYSSRADLDASELKVADLGDLACVYGLPTMLRRVKAVVARIAGDKKVPVMIGGEHTFTYGALE
ncbi:MAG: agmatinase, partial [Anaerolineae bacterium]|nr:agmatinase [Anaerolineae bacterium]NIN99472.1 agmatinase [Anaerolineae bacterium]NIQ82337.1 agmatinase [Anaerolineae bacterium]